MFTVLSFQDKSLSLEKMSWPEHSKVSRLFGTYSMEPKYQQVKFLFYLDGVFVCCHAGKTLGWPGYVLHVLCYLTELTVLLEFLSLWVKWSNCGKKITHLLHKCDVSSNSSCLYICKGDFSKNVTVVLIC